MDDREWLRAELARLGNLPEEELAVRQADLVCRLLKRMVPDIVSSGELDPMIRNYLGVHTELTRDTAMFGGNEASMTKEIPFIVAGASADVLHQLYQVSRKRSAIKVASWLPDLTRRNVETWAAGGSRLKERPDRITANRTWVERSMKQLIDGGADVIRGKSFLRKQFTKIAERLEQ